MSRNPIITSLLDTDLYKLTILQIFFHKFPNITAEYEFRCRKPISIPLSSIYRELNEQLDALCNLRFTDEELDYLRSLPYMKEDFVHYLQSFQLQRNCIHVECDSTKPYHEQLQIRVSGNILQCMLFEIYELALISELVCERMKTPSTLQKGRHRLKVKLDNLRSHEEIFDKDFPFVFFEFGTRRRYSREWQEELVRTLQESLPEYFKGTSNVDLARSLNIPPIGTMAHEYFQAHQVLSSELSQFQKLALDNWHDEYCGMLSIALTDTISTDAFLKDFDLESAKKWKGLRQDSGDPFQWGEKVLAHFSKFGIDAREKVLVFSDSLDFAKTLALYKYFQGRVQTRFGIGTNLSNDLGLESLQIVSKMVRCNGYAVAKISDSPGKIMYADESILKRLNGIWEFSTV